MSTRFGSERLLSGQPIGATTLTISRIALAVLAVGFGIAAAIGRVPSLEVQLVVYLIGMVALNLPHGGYEHFANLRRRAQSFRLWYLAYYLGLIGGFIALFVVAPVAALAIAFGVTVAKGGGGDLHVMAATTGTDHLRSRLQRLLAAVARGGAVIAVPIVAWPETFYAFSAIMVDMFQPGAIAVLPSIELTRWLVGVGYGAVVLTHLGWGFYNRTGSGAFLADAAETGLLVTYFTLVPVVVAIGLYFPLWYSLRQVGREATVETEPPTGGRDLLAADDPSNVALRSWAVLVFGALATGAVAAILWVAAPYPLGGTSLLYGAVAFWTVFICIIALPHVVVGAIFDRRRGIWHVP
ncbi:MAG: Brp/Blh family beta-carotene 15,15'-dioxygenase [Natronomonas sp.]